MGGKITERSSEDSKHPRSQSDAKDLQSSTARTHDVTSSQSVYISSDQESESDLKSEPLVLMPVASRPVTSDSRSETVISDHESGENQISVSEPFFRTKVCASIKKNNCTCHSTMFSALESSATLVCWLCSIRGLLRACAASCARAKTGENYALIMLIVIWGKSHSSSIQYSVVFTVGLVGVMWYVYMYVYLSIHIYTYIMIYVIYNVCYNIAY